jgi:cellulose synthase/poly-beta-1,6-N-acetylglucosamine synthase-like glycosyltransferase
MNAEPLFIFLFWFSAAVIFFTFLGYPLLMSLLAKRFAAPVQKNKSSHLPCISIVLAAHNEERRILPRIQNLLSSDYPSEKIQIVIVSDGSTDGTAAQVRSLADPRVLLIKQPKRSGKSECLNVGVQAASGEIIIFGDLRQRFAPDAISQLVAHFSDTRVGAVSGSLEIETAASAIGGGVDAYWRLEKFLRRSESCLDSCIGCTGAIYAIRRALFRPIPPDTLLDDVVIPMQIVMQKFRVTFEPAAIAYDPQSLEPEREKIRKQRTLAGNYQMMFRYLKWLFPWHNRLWWQLISHKYLRLCAPLFMLLALVSNAFLLESVIFRILFAGQCLFYSLAVLGGIIAKARVKILSLPAGFVFLNLMTLRGLYHHLRGSYREGSWPLSRPGS